MTTKKDELGPEAQKLVELTGGDAIKAREVNVADILKDHPELASGLDEYIRWREDNSAAVAKTDTAKSAGHKLKDAATKVVKEGK